VKIIVADDDASQRLYMSTVLGKLGHVPICVEDGAAALVELESSDAALLICDINMPLMDGLELARSVRQRDFGRYVYVLIITGRDEPGDYVSGFDAGADDFMPKPVDLALLAVRVKAAMRLIAYDRELLAKNKKLAIAGDRIERDLAAAAQAQRQLLPAARVDLAGCTITSYFRASHHVSGDMFGHFALPRERLGFYAADVCGHGVRAALQSVALGHLITPEYFGDLGIDETRQGEICLDRLVTSLDRRFAPSQVDDSYFTLLVGAFDRQSDRLWYCQAGYPSPLLMRADGSTEWIGDGGMPVALMPNAKFQGSSVPFVRGDRLVIHSDAITEAASPCGDPFGAERMIAVMADHRKGDAGLACDALLREVAAWTASAELADDLSLIIIDRSLFP
jgi:sigma-B regulation protein RsbU (phosphoserine phosphatase)